MIYRRWSLLITPPMILGGVVAAHYVYYFHLGGNVRFSFIFILMISFLFSISIPSFMQILGFFPNYTFSGNSESFYMELDSSCPFLGFLSAVLMWFALVFMFSAIYESSTFKE